MTQTRQYSVELTNKLLDKFNCNWDDSYLYTSIDFFEMYDFITISILEDRGTEAGQKHLNWYKEKIMPQHMNK